MPIVKQHLLTTSIVFYSIVVALFFLANFAHAQANDSVARVVVLMGEGDMYAEKTFENENALKKYLDILTIDSTNFEALWKTSRAFVDIAEHLPTSTDEQKEKQLQTYDFALAYANKAIAMKPDSSMGYTRRAIANGRITLFKNVWKSTGLVNDVREDCEKAISLNPNNATAYYVLGRAHVKLNEKPKIFRWPLGVAWGNLDDAIKNYEKAISLRPDFIMFRIDAARAYIEKEDYVKAREHLTLIPTLPTLDEDDDQFRKEATELLEQIKNK